MKVLVIDPFSSGNDLISNLKMRGCDVVDYFQKTPSEANPDWQRNQLDPELLKIAASRRFDAVVAGSDFGVVAAETLAARIGLPTNDPGKIWARRDNLGMLDAMTRDQIRVPRSLLVNSVDAANAAWSELKNHSAGVIVKPVASAGSDACYICASEFEVRNALDAILGEKNLLGILNGFAVVQERIIGDQYFINTVSIEGKHYVTEFFKYGINELGRHPQIFSAISLPESGQLFEEAAILVRKVNDLLGVTFAASHVEVRWCDGEWVLIEYNGRSMGPVVPDEVYKPIRGYSQVSIWADVISGGRDRVRRSFAQGSSDACIGWLMPQPIVDGNVTRADWSSLDELSSFRGVYLSPEKGIRYQSRVRTTSANFGIAFFGAHSIVQVEEDIDTARDFELEGLFYTLDLDVE